MRMYSNVMVKTTMNVKLIRRWTVRIRKICVDFRFFFQYILDVLEIIENMVEKEIA